MKSLAVIALFWLGCSFYNWGTMMADFNYRDVHEYPELKETPRDNVGVAAALAIFGPFGAPPAAVITNFNQHGWTLWDGNSR